MTAAPALTTQEPVAPDADLRDLLMRFAGALSRRRAYAATHPMVQAAEQQLFESATAVLRRRAQLTLGIARSDILVDGEPYVTRSSFARELATRLHRRGVGAITLHAGLTLVALRETLAWLATEDDVSDGDGTDVAPRIAGVSIARVAYDQLVLGASGSIAESTSARLWHALAQAAGDPGAPPTAAQRHGATPAVDDAMLEQLRGAMQEHPDVARRTAIALQDIAAQASAVSGDVRRTMGQQLNEAINRLGASSFAPIIRSLGERSLQHGFVSQVVNVLPAAAIADWLRVAAQSHEQQMSHHLLRLMSKLSVYAEAEQTPTADRALRSAAQGLVRNWLLDDPNPEEHVALLDRIATHERAHTSAPSPDVTRRTADVESARLVQMALEIDVVGDDAIAAAEALAYSGHCVELMDWLRASGGTTSAQRLRAVAVSDAAVRTVLLTEPVDRLEARAILEQLGPDAAEVLLDVLALSEARGTRLLVRQRLAEFGASILPVLLARVDDAPWFLVRNILTLLHEIALESSGSGAALENLVALLDHAQVQVRIEAFRLLVLDARAREAAIRRALHDPHERMVILALQALSDGGDGAHLLSEQVTAQLIAMVDAGAHSEPLRARMVRALTLTYDDRVREWLVAHATRRSRVLRRLQLVDPTPVAIAAVNALRRRYAADPIVQRIEALVHDSGAGKLWQSREPAMPQELSA